MAFCVACCGDGAHRVTDDSGHVLAQTPYTFLDPIKTTIAPVKPTFNFIEPTVDFLESLLLSRLERQQILCERS